MVAGYIARGLCGGGKDFLGKKGMEDSTVRFQATDKKKSRRS